MIHTTNTLSHFHDFSEKIRGRELFFDLKKGGEDFFQANFSQNRPRYPVNFDRSLNKHREYLVKLDVLKFSFVLLILRLGLFLVCS